jgi:hypothetical protein
VKDERGVHFYNSCACSKTASNSSISRRFIAIRGKIGPLDLVSLSVRTMSPSFCFAQRQVVLKRYNEGTKAPGQSLSPIVSAPRINSLEPKT